MLKNILSKNEGKTLEFKENTKSSLGIIKSVIAFANTAGGTIVIGVKDKTKEVVGVEHILQEEERLANIIADSIEPLLFPDIEVLNYEKNELLIINVPYLIGPHYFKKEGLNKGVYVRLGSTNRVADAETIAYLQRLAKQISFDEMPCIGASVNQINDKHVAETLHSSYHAFDKKHYKSLGLIASHNNKNYPSYGALLLFSPNKMKWFPDSLVRCACFAGTSREQIIDQKEITNNLIEAIEKIISFINRHISVAAKIGPIRREDIPQYPSIAIREAVINAVVHADYTIKGSSIQIAVFQDRIEITNPGGLPFGQTIEPALSGVSRMRNRLIGRIFRELKIIEQLGSGIPRIIGSYKEKRANSPKFEEINNHFRVTLFDIKSTPQPEKEWERQLMHILLGGGNLSTNEIASLWKVSDRTARTRLHSMVKRHLIQRIAKSKNDPTATYKLI